MSTLSLEALSRMAHSSPFIFTGSLPSGAGFRSIALSSGCVCAGRRHGGWRLIRKTKLIIDIALDCGFQNRVVHDSFQNRVWSSPRRFRQSPDWLALSTRSALRYRSSMCMDVKSLNFHLPRRVLTHLGQHPDKVNASAAKFIHGGAKQGGRRLPAVKLLVLARPQTTPPDQFRFDICGSVHQPIARNDVGVVNSEDSGGRCGTPSGSLDSLPSVCAAIPRMATGQRQRDAARCRSSSST